MPLRHTRSKRIALLAAVVAIFATPLALFAHAKLLLSSPADGASLPSAPTSISLWFSEKPELKFSSVHLTDSAGTSLALGVLAATDSMGITAPITTPIGPGNYTIAWKTAAADGHATSGNVRFTVTATPLPQSATITVHPGRAPLPSLRNANAVIQPDAEVSMSSAMRWCELVAVITLVGIVIFRLAVVPGAEWTGDALRDVEDRLRRLANATFVLLLVSMMSRAFVQAELLPFQGSRTDALKIVIEETEWGHGWAVGGIGAIVVLIGFALSRKRAAGWPIAAVGLVGVALGQTLTGHSIASPHVALAVATDVSHLLAAGGWIGGLAALMLAGLPTVKRLAHASSADHGSRLLKSYHNTAVECVTLVVISAVINAWLRLGSFDALWKTPYGNMLLRKILFVVVALALGWYHSRRVVPATFSDDVVARFKRSAAAELIVGLVILGFTALLISMPTPR